MNITSIRNYQNPYNQIAPSFGTNKIPAFNTANTAEIMAKGGIEHFIAKSKDALSHVQINYGGEISKPPINSIIEFDTEASIIKSELNDHSFTHSFTQKETPTKIVVRLGD